MTRKRYIKLMMADGFDKCHATRCAWHLQWMQRNCKHSEFSYQDEWDSWVAFEKRCFGNTRGGF